MKKNLNQSSNFFSSNAKALWSYVFFFISMNFAVSTIASTKVPADIPPGCVATKSLSVSGLSSIWVNAGANNAHTFYYGIEQSKDFKITMSGGVGPYSYSWSNSSGYTLQPKVNPNEIRLWEALGSTMMRVTITDLGTSCVYKDSVFISWTDIYVAGKQGPTFIYKTCRNFNTILILGFPALKSAIIANTHTLGACQICAASTTFSPANLNQGWVSAGANNPNLFYHGLSQWKLIQANVSGGVGPYTFIWSNSGSYQLKPGNSANQINLFEPLGPTWVKAQITDVGANCTFIDSIYIGFSDIYYCYSVNGTPYFKVCDSGNSICVPWTTANRDKVFNGTYQLGNCILKTDLALTNEKKVLVYPNPTKDLVNITVNSSLTEVAKINVVDLNGRTLTSKKLEFHVGANETFIDLSALPNGIYLLQVATENELLTERIQIIR